MVSSVTPVDAKWMATEAQGAATITQLNKNNIVIPAGGANSTVVDLQIYQGNITSVSPDYLKTLTPANESFAFGIDTKSHTGAHLGQLPLKMLTTSDGTKLWHLDPTKIATVVTKLIATKMSPVQVQHFLSSVVRINKVLATIAFTKQKNIKLIIPHPIISSFIGYILHAKRTEEILFPHINKTKAELTFPHGIIAPVPLPYELYDDNFNYRNKDTHHNVDHGVFSEDIFTLTPVARFKKSGSQPVPKKERITAKNETLDFLKSLGVSTTDVTFPDTKEKHLTFIVHNNDSNKNMLTQKDKHKINDHYHIRHHFSDKTNNNTYWQMTKLAKPPKDPTLLVEIRTTRGVMVRQPASEKRHMFTSWWNTHNTLMNNILTIAPLIP